MCRLEPQPAGCSAATILPQEAGQLLPTVRMGSQHQNPRAPTAPDADTAMTVAASWRQPLAAVLLCCNPNHPKTRHAMSVAGSRWRCHVLSAANAPLCWVKGRQMVPHRRHSSRLKHSQQQPQGEKAGDVVDEGHAGGHSTPPQQQERQPPSDSYPGDDQVGRDLKRCDRQQGIPGILSTAQVCQCLGAALYDGFHNSTV